MLPANPEADIVQGARREMINEQRDKRKRNHLMYHTRMKEDLLLVMMGLCAVCFGANGQATTGKRKAARPEPVGWYTGDIHVHRSCDGSEPIAASALTSMMEVNDIDVISLLGDMGNNNSADRVADLRSINGRDSQLSGSGRIIHYAAEWHWDADQWEFPHQALGGHLILLGLTNAQKMWEESTFRVLDWAGRQNAVRGFAHMQYLNNRVQDTLNCCIPIDYPVEVALNNVEFLSQEQPRGSENGILAYYKLLNCGFRPALAGGTDYPCNKIPLGAVLTYVQVADNKLTYDKWIEGIAKGRTVVSRNAHNEFLDLKVNHAHGPGDEIRLAKGGEARITASWTVNAETTGQIEFVCNGDVIARRAGTARPGAPLVLTFTQPFTRSGWITARRMDSSGRKHALHTSPVYVSVDGKPVRASRADAEYFVAWIDNILAEIAPGGRWNNYFPSGLDAAMKRYERARNIYRQIAAECSGE